MTDKTPSQIAEDIAHELQGTCNSLQSALEYIEREDLELNTEFTGRLDELVFECEQCGWWHEQSEMGERDDDRWICEDCTNE